MMPRFRYIQSGPGDGFRNMAVDEVLLERCGRDRVEGVGGVDGVLRVYQWSPPALSLGHSQPIDMVDLEQCSELGVDVVKRITGGGAVLHWDEITYCLILNRMILPGLRPQGIKLADLKWPREFIAMTGAALCEALGELGIETSPSAHPDQLARPVRLSGSSRSANLPLGDGSASADFPVGEDASHSPICFSRGVEHEVLVNGRKLAGSAHKFTKEVFFSHGSILTGNAHLKIVDLIRSDSRSITLPGLSKRSVSMAELLRNIPELETVGIELRKSIETRIGCAFAESRLSGQEENMVEERALDKRRCAVSAREAAPA